VVAPNQNHDRVPLDGEAAGFVGPTEACALGGPRRIAGALITNLPQTCSALNAKSGGNSSSTSSSSSSSSSSGLYLYIGVEGTDLPALGAYRIEDSVQRCAPGNDVIAELVVDGAKHKSTRGKIELTAANATKVSGSFDLTFESGGHARGTFTAPVCNVDWTLFGRPRPREELR